MKKYSEDRKIDAKTVLVTSDMGKGTHHAYMKYASGEIKPFEFSNNLDGFMKMTKRLENFKKRNNLEKIVFGFESTGSYGDPLKLYMQQLGAELVQVNPMHTKRLKELTDNSPNKTDKKDPRVIADIVMLGHGLTAVIPEGSLAELREHVASRENRVEDINRVKNRMEALLARYFPEFLQIMGLRTKTSIYLLKEYTTAEEMAKKGITKLSEAIHKVSRGQIKYAKVQKLHQAATETIGLKQGLQAYSKEIRRLIQGLETLEQQQDEIEKDIESIVEQLPETRILRSIKGVGFITSAYLLSEVVDFKSYKVQKEIEKFAGLNLYEISSGKHQGQRKLSKRGRALIRKALYMCVVNMVRSNGIYYEDYQRYLKRGVQKIKALVIIMRKLLRMAFSLIKRDELFVDNYKSAA